MSKGMTTLEIVQSKLPHWYKKYEKDNSIMYAVLKALTDQLDISSGHIDRLDDMIGIDTTRDEDLEYRWGSLLNMPKSPNESYDDYRSKLMMTYSAMMNGGTEEAIKFAIAAVLGINRRNENVDKYIKVYDAWEYTGQIQGYDGGYGGFVCEIDFRVCEGVLDYYGKINETIHKVKASGVMSYMVVIYISSEDNVKIWMDEAIVDAINVLDDELATISSKSDILDKISHEFNDISSISSNDSMIINPALNSSEFMLNVNIVLNEKIDVSVFDAVVMMSVMEIFKMSISDDCVDSINTMHDDNIDISLDDTNSDDIITSYGDDISVDVLDNYSDVDKIIDYTYMNIECVLDNIDNMIMSAIESINIECIDSSTDDVKRVDIDIATIETGTSGVWSCIGTNSYTSVLNDSMITNMFMDIDECIDVINYK